MLHSVNTRLPRSTGGHLVTGSTGFIGGALVLELLARTEGRVVVVVRDGDRAPARASMTPSGTPPPSTRTRVSGRKPSPSDATS